MTKLVFLSGDFCSGSTLLFTLFRQTQQYHCLYEPLHELLPEYLIWPLREYEHHFFVRDYFAEYRGFRRIPELFNPEWGHRGLHLQADAEADDLYRYLSYLIDMAFGRSSKVLLKFNRATFRLPWLHAKFPEAKIVHIWREPHAQWRSVVQRGQAHFGRDDIGQDSAAFNGFNVARWCDDLEGQFPELAIENSRTGYDRFRCLWELSRNFHQQYADVSVQYESLSTDFERTCGRIWDTVGCTYDLAALRPFVVRPSDHRPLESGGKRWRDLIDRAGRRYAHYRVLAARRWRQRWLAASTTPRTTTP